MPAKCREGGSKPPGNWTVSLPFPKMPPLMATRRSASSRSRPRGRRTAPGSRRPPARRGRPSSSPNPLPWILGIGGLGLFLLLFALNSGTGGKKTGRISGTHEAAAAPRATPSKQRPAPSPARGPGTPGKPPARPAPAIDSSLLADCEADYRKAKEAWNVALRHKGEPDQKVFNAKVREAREHLDRLFGRIRPQLDWEEEASLEEWAVPAPIVDLMRRYTRWNKLMTRIHKIGHLK